jgi:hypothetical protein
MGCERVVEDESDGQSASAAFVCIERVLLVVNGKRDKIMRSSVSQFQALSVFSCKGCRFNMMRFGKAVLWNTRRDASGATLV